MQRANKHGERITFSSPLPGEKASRDSPFQRIEVLTEVTFFFHTNNKILLKKYQGDATHAHEKSRNKKKRSNQQKTIPPSILQTYLPCQRIDFKLGLHSCDSHLNNVDTKRLLILHDGLSFPSEYLRFLSPQIDHMRHNGIIIYSLCLLLPT